MELRTVRNVPWQAVDLDTRHSAQVRALFAEVFGGPLTPELWHWKYADGRGLATGTRDRQGRLLAHYGGTARTLWMGGRAVTAVQLGDVMVAPEARGFLSRNGPFSVATRHFLQQHVGPGRAFALGFGFPGERHVRLGRKLGLYEATQEVLHLHWPVARPPALGWRLRWRAPPIDWAAGATGEALDGLWQAMRAQTQGYVIGERDAHWWRHRFANHPEVRYQCWWLGRRHGGAPLAAFALKPADAPGQPWELLDWIAPPQYAPVVAQAARTLAARAGCGLMAWLSRPVAEALQACEPSGEAPRSHVACMACVTLHQDNAALGHDALPWWLTGGDTDFR
ncbi:Acetyltransferase (GNAT) domain-containing protein [Oryzisolibacter propanilivorax]|uniref:Acetyltransferase (GNAT) domain-containing protein n=1 Tax=Oryzisolibacter propanilivorax TaxID=1527607 RepID=A0A1G9S4E6_9BURK|nr:GNAT family N-acetyltransferase [Oryzisolibacter propanilivorax]SDM30379.1 Acetyltransferase (GNAT) domain-containing protein [Oryzisolibacter propanilivorax]